ncbi:hypothetical protein Tco_0470429, partial [Tanacetum coccineum]
MRSVRMALGEVVTKQADALPWWKAFKQAKGGETYVATLSWKDFRDIFFLQYF